MMTVEVSKGDAGVSARRRTGRVWVLPVLLLTVLALMFDQIGTWNDLWLDEILSVQMARQVTSAWQVFTLHTDNNHYLNTLYLHLVGDPGDFRVFRYFSVFCGTLLIPAGFWLGAQHTRRTGLILATMLTFSYPVIHFCSEARGYGAALLGCVVAGAAAMAFERRGGWWMASVYGVAMGFAIVAHLTACLVWLPLGLGVLVICGTKERRWVWVVKWVGANVVPAGVLGALYFVDIRWITPLGGPVMTPMHGMLRLAALALGWPGRDAYSVLVVLVPVAGVIVWQLVRMVRRGEVTWVIVGLILVMPVVCAVVLKPAFFSPRYFLVIVPFLYFPVAMVVSGWMERPKARGVFAAGVAVLGIFVVGEFRVYMEFLRMGRGEPSKALRYISQQTGTPFINIASSQDLRAQVELAYFGPKIFGKKRPVSYIRQQDQTFFSPEWYILHSEGFDPEGPERLELPDQPVWRRVGYFPAAELSGQAWTVYRRVGS